MKAKDIIEALSRFGITLSEKTLAIIAFALPLVVLGSVKLYKEYQKRRQKRAEQGPEMQRAAGEGGGQPEIATNQLRKTWRRFLLRLPRTYRRSILNFEHFILLGTAASGKSRLLDTQTDWSYQMKQVAAEGPVDSEMPTYLASGAVISELPARYLEDNSESCRKALDHLWRPLYRQRTPTVVVVLDVSWLTSSSAEARRDLALSARIKINQLSAIRGRPIDVRVALTHLDQLAGFNEAARFWAHQGIANRIVLAAQGKLGPSLEEWEQETRAHLSRALTALDAADFRRFVAFLKNTSSFLMPLEHLLDMLFEVEPISLSPVRGGVFLCSDVRGTGSPLANASERGPGPNPLRRHLFTAVAAASLCVVYFGFAYQKERAQWILAAREMASHSVAREFELGGREHEIQQRAVICDFTVKTSGFVSRFPGFFHDVREEMRAALADRLREKLIKPQIQYLAQTGIVGKDNMTLRWRRTVYGIGILHSYRNDGLHIRDDFPLWSQMTGLPKDVIRDYLDNSSVPYVTPLALEFSYANIDKHDTAAYWAELPSLVSKAMSDGIIDRLELTSIQQLAQEMRQVLARFDHDDTTLEVLRNIDSAAKTDELRKGHTVGTLFDAYAPVFEKYVQSTVRTNMKAQSGALDRMLLLVTSAHLPDFAAPDLLGGLIDEIVSLNERAAPDGAPQEAIRLVLGSETFELDVRRWSELIRNGKIEFLIDGFAAARRRESIFFTPALEAELADVVWNALGAGDSIFQGHGILRGRYTRAGFERRVRKDVLRLVEVLKKTPIPLDHKKKLATIVHAEVASYARFYRAEAERFLRAYKLHAPSIEALRVALGQISAEASTFDDFVSALDTNTDLDLGTNVAVDKATGATSAAPAAPAAPGAPAAPAAPTDKAPTPAGDIELGADHLLSPMATELEGFDSWHRAVGARGHAPELAKYKEIVKQLLTDLTAVSTEEESTEGKEDAESDLEQELSPAGKVTFGTLGSRKNAYATLARKWADDAGLTNEQRAPFLAPFSELHPLGKRDIESVVKSVWNNDLCPIVQDIARKFPFDRRAATTVLPDEVTLAFHPTDGSFAELVREHIAPLSSDIPRQPIHQKLEARSLRFPAGLYPTVNAVRDLAEQLWDEKGAPRKLAYELITVPFKTEVDAELVPTVVYLKTADSSVLNFNQKPTPSTLLLDWTKDENAQLGIQVTSRASDQTTFPAPLAASGPYWRFLRLLADAEVSAAPEPPDAKIYSWRLPLKEGARETARVQLKVLGNVWKAFSRVAAEAKECSSAP